MLAKQVWWLVHDINSLFYKIFKAIYFPSNIVIEAKATSRSYDWKNILWTRIAISMGAKWRIHYKKSGFRWRFKNVTKNPKNVTIDTNGL